VSDIDVSKLSLAELSDVASHIDRVKFPERAAAIDEELARRRQLPSKLRIADLARSGRNGWFVAAGVVGACGLVPFLISSILNSVGAINTGSGLGFGLLLFFCGFLAAILFAIGAVAERIQSR